MKPAWAKLRIPFLYRICLFIAWTYFKLFFRLKIYGHVHYVRGKGIIAPNHASYLDPPVVSVSWPDEVQFLAKEALFKSFLFGHLIRALNSHPVRGTASDIAVFKLIHKLLEEGKKVIVFPEGGRTQNGNLQPIKHGISLLAAKSGAPVIPTYIEGAFAAWPPGRKFPKICGKLTVVFGSPIYFEEFAHLQKKEAHQALADRLQEKLASLKQWLDEGAQGSPP